MTTQEKHKPVLTVALHGHPGQQRNALTPNAFATPHRHNLLLSPPPVGT